MLNRFVIVLHAENIEKNHHRMYELTASYNLLEEWVIGVRFGRIGGRYNRVLQFVAADIDEVHKMLRERLQRRATAEKRISCKYKIKRLDASEEFDLDQIIPKSLKQEGRGQ